MVSDLYHLGHTRQLGKQLQGYSTLTLIWTYLGIFILCTVPKLQDCNHKGDGRGQQCILLRGLEHYLAYCLSKLSHWQTVSTAIVYSFTDILLSTGPV